MRAPLELYNVRVSGRRAVSWLRAGCSQVSVRSVFQVQPVRSVAARTLLCSSPLSQQLYLLARRVSPARGGEGLLRLQPPLPPFAESYTAIGVYANWAENEEKGEARVTLWHNNVWTEDQRVTMGGKCVAHCHANSLICRQIESRGGQSISTQESFLRLHL